MKDRIVVAVDAMGSDNAPDIEVKGAVDAAGKWGIPIILIGDSARIQENLKRYNIRGLNIRVQHASEIVTMNDHPADAVRRKRDSSIRVAFELVKSGEAQAVVSAGNSGATLAAGMFILKRLPGIDRPAIATIFPSRRGRTLILDVGGTVDCKPHQLAQFAFMGDLFARHLMKKKDPVVGLLSNGSEESKGVELTREAHLLLKDAPFNYKGYIEGRDIFDGGADVVVCDGFVGNVVLKTCEGLAECVSRLLREEIRSRFLGRLGYLLARPAFAAFKKKVDYSEVGGAPLLGIDGIGMICHGGSSSKAIMNAIFTAREYVANQINEKLLVQIQNHPMHT